MKERKTNKSKRLIFRISEADYTTLEKQFQQSDCRKFSEYLRSCVLQKPVIKTIRNSSMDELMEDLIRLRNQLSPLGNNLNQAVKRLHTLSQNQQQKSWLAGFELQQKVLLNKLEEINNTVLKIAESWLQ